CPIEAHYSGRRDAADARSGLVSDPLPLQGDDADEERDDEGCRDPLRQPVAARDGVEGDGRDDHEEREASSASETTEALASRTPLAHGSAILDPGECPSSRRRSATLSQLQRSTA